MNLLKFKKKIFELKHRNTFNSVNNFGSILTNQNKYEEIETMYRRALKECEKIFESEHRNTFINVNTWIGVGK